MGHLDTNQDPSNFQRWYNKKLIKDMTNKITSESDINQDWFWLFDRAFSLIEFNDVDCIKIVANIFKIKWIKNLDKNFEVFCSYEHDSLVMCSIMD